MARHGDKSARRAGESRPRRRCALERLESRCLLSASVPVTSTYSAALAVPTNTATISVNKHSSAITGVTPQQVLEAYGFNSAENSLVGQSGGNGAGQTIAIVEAWNDPTIVADLHVFDQQFGLADPASLTRINQNGGKNLPGVSATWSQETALDVEWAHAIAPGADIVIVEANSDRISDLLTAVQAARNLPQVSVVSMSWGVDEFPTETSFDGIFTTPAGHQGITFVASAGETQSASGTSSGVQWPAASPNVLSVGGSSSDNSTSGSYWPTSLNGISKYETQPTYVMAGSDPVAITTDSQRVIPDVFYSADPSLGYAVYDKHHGWATLGGTSAGAPQWGALIAIANQVRSAQDLPSLDGVTQTIPDIYQSKHLSADGSGMTSVYGGSGNFTLALNGQTLVFGNLESSAYFFIVNNDASTTLQENGILELGSVQALSKKHAKVFYFVVPRPAQASTLAFAMTSSANLDDAMRAVLAHTLSMAGAVDSQGLSLTPGGEGSLPGTIAAALVGNGAYQTATAVVLPEGEVFTKAFAALFAGTPGPVAAGEVVPVGSDGNTLPFAASATHYYIAHLDVAGTFGDAIGAFINECAAGPRAYAAADPPNNAHTRAWTITAGILTLDILVAAHLAARRFQRQAPTGYVQWWREPVRRRDEGKIS